ncbi:cerato-platanin-related secreted protein [Moniliophthora roreri MCA 2997]|uniref:Cerato-platanin-related secreted protein n=2 Tax=Moniliophthora roreri TaxID=221103 RepID=V2Y6Z5_MONRO|nr:putative cerato-platanin 7 [Moniliophthora roreri]ESK87449.1 cerato-platanin-related secreted protein [Moniliophthora roreri MCA 2997]
MRTRTDLYLGNWNSKELNNAPPTSMAFSEVNDIDIYKAWDIGPYSPAHAPSLFSSFRLHAVLTNLTNVVIMKFTAAIALLATSAAAVRLQYDPTYDNRDGSLGTTACSDGPNGLITKGFSTFGSLPNFPRIGAVDAITGWNSPQCGSCWQVTWNGKSINILGMDVAGNGFNVAQAAMDELTDGQAVALGNIDVQATQVDASVCGL